MPDHIRPGDEGYEAILAFYKKNEGTIFVYKGDTWTAIQDNDELVFHRTGSLSGIDGRYEEYSLTRG